MITVDQVVEVLSNNYYPNNDSTYDVMVYPIPVVKHMDRLLFYTTAGITYSLKIDCLNTADIRDMVEDVMRLH
mgnify:CR=1 FL=1